MEERVKRGKEGWREREGRERKRKENEWRADGGEDEERKKRREGWRGRERKG